MSSFNYFELKLVEPSWGDPVTDIILELEKLRTKNKVLRSAVSPVLFSELKEIFHILESLGSVRIEGNNTTLAEIVERSISPDEKQRKVENYQEFLNNQAALHFIEENVQVGDKITKAHILEIHKLIVYGLEREGDRTPGQYRKSEVVIARAEHKPPPFSMVEELMNELFDFIGKDHPPKDNLLVSVLAHHRFAWIHPFSNGNGRTVRALTYAMLIAQGFAVNRIINPTAVFCNNRDAYYENLAVADTGMSEGLLKWSYYVLSSLLEENKKIEKLLDAKFLREKIIVPALAYSKDRQLITDVEKNILTKAFEKGELMAADIKPFINAKYSNAVTRLINKLLEKKMLQKQSVASRKYLPSIHNNYLLRGFIESLRENKFIPFND